jgi:hypothetical protein
MYEGKYKPLENSKAPLSKGLFNNFLVFINLYIDSILIIFQMLPGSEWA